MQTIYKIACLLKPGGHLFLGVPTGLDRLMFNAHRIYGAERLRQLFANFDVLGVEGSYDKSCETLGGHTFQPLFILQKREA